MKIDHDQWLWLVFAITGNSAVNIFLSIMILNLIRNK